METPVYGVLYEFTPRRGDIAVLRREFDERLLPLAKLTGVIRAPNWIHDAWRIYLNSADEQTSMRDPREVAAYYLGMVDSCLRAAQVLSEQDEPEPELDWEGLLHDAAVWIPYLFGYLASLRDFRAQTIRRGANGRKLIGANTRARAMQAAEKHRGLMPKDDAAPLIASEIGKSTGTVRKLLAKLFPGDEWYLGGTAASTDSAGKLRGRRMT